MPWTTDTEDLEGGRVRRITMRRNGQAVSFAEAIGLWRSDPSFRDFFIALLADAPFEAYFWETPPVTEQTQGRDFEFILAESRALASFAADPTAFAQIFRTDESGGETVSFPNLGGDALLIAPRPRSAEDAYPHLAAFSRRAPSEQQHALWQEVGEVVAQNLSDHPLWLSTSGLGVAWLHVRLDSRPKYYTFQPYRNTK